MALPELVEALVAPGARPWRSPARGRGWPRRWSGSAYEAEQAKAEPQLHLRRAERGLLLAVTPELAEYAERLGEVADALAAEDPLPPPLRVFQRLYEVAPPRIPARLPAAEQRPAPPPRRRRQPRRPPSRPGRSCTRAGMPARRALRLGLGALSGLEAGDVDARGAVHDRGASASGSRRRYPEAEPLPDRPGAGRLAPRGRPRRRLGRRRARSTGRPSTSRADLGLDPTPSAQHAPPGRDAGAGRQPAGGRGPPVRGAAAATRSRRRLPRADGPAEPDAGVRGAADRAVPRAGAGVARSPAAGGAPRRRPRTGSTGRSSARPTAPRRE